MINYIKHKLRVLKSNLRENKKSKQRSPHWNETRDLFLKTHNVCEACGSNEKLQVHHMMPFHLNPELELDINNFIVLCMSDNECHLNLGHGDNFKYYNPNVKNDSLLFKSSNKDDRILIVQEAKKLRKL